ncbi:4279_t:CDS:2, partial [Racocetra persica]
MEKWPFGYQCANYFVPEIVNGFLSMIQENELLILEEFINTLQLLKNYSTYCVHSFALVGMLFNQYSKQYGINLDICRISEDIYECTNGHKGLVGACCKAIETEVMMGKNELSFDQWMKYSSTRLIKFIKKLRAYKSIVRVIKNLLSKPMDIISICNNEDGEIYRLFAEGIIVSKSVNEDYIEMEFSSLILQSIILSMICGPDIDITNPPQTINKIDINWLLENTIE